MDLAQRNRKLWEAIKKGDISVADLISNGGYLPTEMENKFLRKVYDSTPFLQSIRRVDMNAPKRRINKIGITGNFLNVAPASGTALDAAKRSKVFTEYVELTTSELIGSMYIPYDVIEDNLERGALEDTIFTDILPQKISRDLEKLVIQGDADSQDNLLTAFDGVIVQLTDANDNVVAFDDSTGIPGIEMFEEFLEALPWEYRELHQALRFMVHYSTVDKFVYEWMERLTTGGDVHIDTDHLASHGFRGIPLMPSSRIPAANGILTVPNNIILGVQRGIQFETARDIEARVIIVVVTMRVAVGIEETEAAVLATGINPSGTTTTTTT
jgi:HK97 family phage major capsid protein